MCCTATSIFLRPRGYLRGERLATSWERTPFGRLSRRHQYFDGVPIPRISDGCARCRSHGCEATTVLWMRSSGATEPYALQRPVGLAYRSTVRTYPGHAIFEPTTVVSAAIAGSDCLRARCIRRCNRRPNFSGKPVLSRQSMRELKGQPGTEASGNTPRYVILLDRELLIVNLGNGWRPCLLRRLRGCAYVCR